MNVLFITYFWPPSGKASIHWPLSIIKYFVEDNVTVSVLTVENESFSQKDNVLFSDIPNSVKVYKTKALEPFDLYKRFTGKKKDEIVADSETISLTNPSITKRIAIWIRMNLFIPDARIGWYFSATKKGNELCGKEKFDCIISSGPPHSVHLIAKKISQQNSVPYIPVLIDPWTDIAYYRNFKRSLLTRTIDSALEKSVLQNSMLNVFVTETMKRDYIAKYRDIEKKSRVLYWGYDESKFVGIEKVRSDKKTLLHSGNIFDFQNPKKLWLRIRKIHEATGNILLKFTGSVSPGIKEAIKEAGIESITEYKGFLSYNAAVEEMMNAEWLLVCATESRHLPGKLFEYIRTGNKILAFGDDNSEVESILKKSNAGTLFSYLDDPEDFFSDSSEFSTKSSEYFAYDRKNIAKELLFLINMK